MDIQGTEFDDNLVGTANPDTISGLGGNDMLDGGGGADDLSGGQGNDIYIVDNGADVVRELAGEGADLVYTSVSYALAAGQEVETLSTRVHGGTDAINLIGNEFAQTIIGNFGANVIDGRGGADVMVGFAGDDLYVVDNALDQVLEGGGQGNDTIVTNVSYVLSSNQEIETLSTQTHAGTDDVFLTGNQYNNTLIGNAGDNILNGVGGADVMIGLDGDDTYAIDDAGDLVVDGAGQGNDLVLTYLSHTLTNGNEIETLSTVFHQGTTAIDLGGNDYNNTLIGNYGANYLNGNGGVDVMIGLNGNDTYVADNAADVVAGGCGRRHRRALQLRQLHAGGGAGGRDDLDRRPGRHRRDRPHRQRVRPDHRSAMPAPTSSTARAATTCSTASAAPTPSRSPPPRRRQCRHDRRLRWPAPTRSSSAAMRASPSPRSPPARCAPVPS